MSLNLFLCIQLINTKLFSFLYSNTNDEDISLRLATRQAEQKLRKDEYQLSMELMRQRVRATPLLLEGPTYWEPKVGQASHRCKCCDMKASIAYDKKKKYYHSQTRNNSKLSNYTKNHNKDEFYDHLDLNKDLS